MISWITLSLVLAHWHKVVPSLIAPYSWKAPKWVQVFPHYRDYVQATKASEVF